MQGFCEDCNEETTSDAFSERNCLDAPSRVELSGAAKDAPSRRGKEFDGVRKEKRSFLFLSCPVPKAFTRSHLPVVPQPCSPITP